MKNCKKVSQSAQSTENMTSSSPATEFARIVHLMIAGTEFASIVHLMKPFGNFAWW